MSAVMKTDTLLEATELHAHYGQSHVLQGVGLRIARGEAVGLLGRNGMGKTTFIRTLLGQIKASGGRVNVTGQDMTGQPPERIVRLGIGYVPEGRGVFPNLSVRENLVMAARAGTRGQRDWTFERVLETFPRLAERLDHGGGQLSGGEQQMMAIGRALMTNPDLMILDEATEGLAPLVVAEIWRVIGLIRASGIASLVVDRNFRKVLAHTDRCVVLEKGRVVLEGPSAALAKDEAALHRYLGV
jgi:branched-chain amino acid transport system ATP-binding protein